MKINSTNFREIKTGKIAPNLLYRSNHPICNGKQVADIILFMDNVKIETIINLSDNLQSLKSKIICCPYYKKIFDENNVIVLNINMKFNIMENIFCQKIKKAILFIIDHNPPYLIHCEAGVDRTGFFSIIVEAFMESKFDDIVKDYMSSFVDIDEYSIKDYKNGSVFVKNLFTEIKGELINQDNDFGFLSNKYLKDAVGLNENELMYLRNKLMNERKT
jgi:protein tyrosine/serine phosphatase